MQRFYPLIAFLLVCIQLNAQLPVEREAHHKIIVENPYFRLLEGKVPAGDTTPAHVHAANSVVVFLSPSTFGIQVVGDKPVIATINPGDLRYLAYGDKPVNHIVWNQTPSLFHFFVVELAKKPVTNDSCPILSQPGIILQIQQSQVKAYSIDIGNDHPLHLESSLCARLLIAITGAVSAAGATLTPDHYQFFPPKTPIELKGDAHCVLLEMN